MVPYLGVTRNICAETGTLPSQFFHRINVLFTIECIVIEIYVLLIGNETYPYKILSVFIGRNAGCSGSVGIRRHRIRETG